VTDENQNPTPETAESQSPQEKKKGGMVKYILFGVIGIVVVIGVAYGTLMFMGGGAKPVPETSDATRESTTTEPEAKEPTDEEILDSLLGAEDDPEIAEMIQQNLAVLDYEPDPSDLGTGTGGMSEEDSTKAVNWLEQEKKRLAEWEAELNTREKSLKRLDAEVSKKVLKLEQAESTRITNLARLYDGMDSRAVARLMASLDDETVVSILPRMKAKNASQVLQLLPSQRAARLSKKMITIAEK